ncbi:MAG: PRC-barrel domain-containing protein [Candidatus Thermoplasmatota archaeon]|jgi:sporulation protein YlmC with PRC-barrel domain|nr:PRC-barrel domain-containing protein [Candidatus Thermoplasmatota archaeon]
MHELVGKYVKDTNDIELGTIVDLKDGYFEIEEGVFGTFFLDVAMVVAVGEAVGLDASIQTVLHNKKVLDKEGEELGTVHDVMEADDVMDFILVAVGEKLFSIPIENLHRIGDVLELNIDREEAEYIQEEHSFREEIVHRIKGFLHMD